MPLSETQPKVAVKQLGYIRLGVSNLEDWREFATAVLGLQENGSSQDGGILLRLDDYHHRIIVSPTGEDDITLAAWEVQDRNAMLQVAEQVRAHDIEVTIGTDVDAAERMVLGLVKFHDPNGLATEIYYGPLIDHRPFVSPRGVKGFRAGSLGLGHIVIGVKDVDQSYQFYSDALGFRASDWIRIARGSVQRCGVFSRINGRHHSLAMGNPADPSKTTRLSHFMLEVLELDDAGIALDIFQQRGLAAGQFGRHSNDRMVSFYAPTPSGFMVEYGWDGLTVDDADWDVHYHGAASLWGHGIAPALGQPQPAKA